METTPFPIRTLARQLVALLTPAQLETLYTAVAQDPTALLVYLLGAYTDRDPERAVQFMMEA